MRMRIRLPFLGRKTMVVPKMQVVSLHLEDVVAQNFEEPADTVTSELRRIAVVKVEDEFLSVGFYHASLNNLEKALNAVERSGDRMAPHDSAWSWNREVPTTQGKI